MFPFDLICRCGKQVPLNIETEKNAERYSSWVTSSVGGKADKYKCYSRTYSILSTALSLSVLFCLMFSEVDGWTIAASVITIFNSIILAWSQLEKPHERWRLYRKYHRMFESERVKYLNSIEPYDKANSDQLFFSELSKLQLKLHDEWEGLVPTTDEVHQHTQKGN